MKSAAKIPTGQYYALITAKVFTAFMFEGVIHHLGEKLCSTWNQGPKPLAFRDLSKRHKAIHCFLQLDNSGAEYQHIGPLVSRLVEFRDSFAHPKVCQQVIEDSVQSELAAIPDIAWEAEVDASNIEREYQELENYCRELLETAATRLEDTDKRGYPAWLAAYPHLVKPFNPPLEAAYLRAFLFSPRYTSTDLFPEVG
jgi:hypothetical protein